MGYSAPRNKSSRGILGLCIEKQTNLRIKFWGEKLGQACIICTKAIAILVQSRSHSEAELQFYLVVSSFGLFLQTALIKSKEQ